MLVFISLIIQETQKMKLNSKIAPIIVTIINIISRSSYFLLFIIIGNKFAISDFTDKVFYILAPQMMLLGIGSSVIEATIIPTLHKTDLGGESKYVIRYFVRKIILILIPISILFLIIFSISYGRFDVYLIMILFPIPLFGILSSIKTNVLFVSRKFNVAMMGPLFGGIVTIPIVLLLPNNVYSLAFAILLFEVFKMVWLYSFRDDFLRIIERGNSNALKIAQWGWHNAKWQIIGSSTLSLIVLVDIWFAYMVGNGAITYVEYANKLWNAVPLAFAGHILFKYSSFSVSANASNKKLYSKNIHFIAIKYGFIAFVVSVIIIIFSNNLINILYGFGNFIEKDKESLTSLFKCYLFGSSFYVGGLIYVRAFSALGKTRILTYIALIGLIFNLILDYVLIRYFGIQGIGLATSIVYMSNTILLVYMCQKHI